MALRPREDDSESCGRAAAVAGMSPLPATQWGDNEVTDAKVKRVKVYMIMCQINPPKWTRVGTVYRNRQAAIGWVPLVRGRYRGAPTMIETATIESIDGKPTAEAVKLFDRRYNIDLT